MLYIPQTFIDEFGGMEREASTEEFEHLKEKILDQTTLKEEIENKVGKYPVRIKGSMSYVEQSSWIQNKTIRDNILFGRLYDENLYKKTLKSCQLESDLAILPAGDQTEIGEKGINLSGGQKARISLARAVYQSCDTIVMDDPISALDSSVRKKIFTQVFQGMLKNKTRILVTHAIDFLHFADRLVILKEGKIQAIGTYQEL